MLLLLINTCGSAGLLALATEDRVLAEQNLPGRGSSEHFMPALRQLFTVTGRTVRDLSAVAAVDGPGSFTGVRVGVAAAKGLCEAVGCPLVAISRLWLLAGAGAEDACAVLDAGRGEFFVGDRDTSAVWRERLLGKDATLDALALRTAFACEPQVITALGARVRLMREPGAAALRDEALRRLASGDVSDIATLDANYLRRTDAELKREP